MRRYVIFADEVYSAAGIVKNAAVVIEDGRIAAVCDEYSRFDDAEVQRFPGCRIIPGLIDPHIHGANGFDAMQATEQALNEMSLFLAANGVTAFLPTTVTERPQKIVQALANINACKALVEGAQVLGAYLEGPYFSATHRGAHPKELLCDPGLEDMACFLKAAGGNLRTVALAPEKEGAVTMIEYLKRRGIRCAIGHSDASYQQTQQAVAAGATIAVHTFNGMRGFTHREPGILGAVLTNDALYAELIADLVHTHPAAIQLLLRAKSADKIVLISDSMQAAGLQDGAYRLGAQHVKVKDGIVRTLDGSLAGSATNLLQCVVNLIQVLQVEPFWAVQMATLNTAQMLGIAEVTGSIQSGKQADIAVIDQKWKPVLTMVRGRIVFRKEEKKRGERNERIGFN